MIETINYLLVFLGFSIMLFTFVARKTPIEQVTFARLSSVFMTAFFLIPAFFLIEKWGIDYAGRFHASNDIKMLNSLISFYFFLIGFLWLGKKLQVRERHTTLNPHINAPPHCEKKPPYLTRGFLFFSL